MNLERTLKIAVEIARALGELHRSGSVHQDIRPQNLRIDPDLARVELLPPGERSGDGGRPGAVPLTRLPYLAPEQTGRMNRPVDHRADLYALGVTLYEMISGALPFEAAEPIGWIHAHIAKSPRPLAEAAPGTPAVICDIVHKLLAKAADERYQTARGLGHDLERCVAELAARGDIAQFPVGRQLCPSDIGERDP